MFPAVDCALDHRAADPVAPSLNFNKKADQTTRSRRAGSPDSLGPEHFAHLSGEHFDGERFHQECGAGGEREIAGHTAGNEDHLHAGTGATKSAGQFWAVLPRQQHVGDQDIDLTGVILRCHDEAPLVPAREALRLIDAEPVLNQELLPLTKGDRVFIVAKGIQVEAEVVLASENHRSLMVTFEAILCGFAGMAQILWTDGAYALLNGVSVEIWRKNGKTQ